MADPVAGNEVLGAFGVVVGGACITIAMFVLNYLKGKAEGAQDLQGRHVILEQAELRDFGDLPKELRQISAKMEQVFTNTEDSDANQKEMLRILRRLETELEVARRIREERQIGH